MEFISSGWWLALALALLLGGVMVRFNYKRNRKEAQIRADKSTILNIYNEMAYGDIKTYKDLPNREARVAWLKRHYPAFVEASERQYDESSLEGVIAVYLDFRILQGVTSYTTRERALSGYQYASYKISLNEHQENLNIFNAEQARLAKIEAEYEAKRRAERAVEEKARKEAAKAHWDSLSTEEKEAFKNARGTTERQKVLGSTDSTGYSAETLYPLIMATEFSTLNVDSHNSIDHSQSHPHSGFHDGGSHSSSGGHYDGGSHSFDGGGGFMGHH